MHRTLFPLLLAAIGILSSVSIAFGQIRYATRGQNIVDAETGKTVLLQGFGIGGWLLPEGYMWGIRTLDRPRQFEAAIEELIGSDDAAEFWRRYHDNFFTEEDVAAIKAMGANSIRIALLASMLQPRDSQPDAPPFVYSEVGFSYLDSVMAWADRHDIGVIWDMHGAPGAQNAENISDSDGNARLWTEPDTYWPRLVDLWMKIARRYYPDPHVIGYDLLNEPLLRRYEGVDPTMLREIYVLLTDSIRAVDPSGLIFIEGDDWAQEFTWLEPIDWDPNLVLSFHSYPPAGSRKALARWDELRQKYNVPLWHGETGEQSSPFDRNKEATEFLNASNVGWSWWTHKKLNSWTQPWFCPKTRGFQRILDFWMERAERPSREDARASLFEMAKRTNTRYCTFLPDMVESLRPLSPDAYFDMRDPEPPTIFEEPDDRSVEAGYRVRVSVRALGFPVEYQWFRNGEVVDGAKGPYIQWVPFEPSDGSELVSVRVFNDLGDVRSRDAVVTVRPYSGPVVPAVTDAPEIDGEIDQIWREAIVLPLSHLVVQRSRPPSKSDLSAEARVLSDGNSLYVLVDVTDDVRVATDPRSYNSDGVEIYVDARGDKSMNYGRDDYQIRINRGFPDVVFEQGEPRGSVQAARLETEGGYRVEVALPFSSLSADADQTEFNGFIGFDVHVNDADDEQRENKITWFGRRDNAYASPGNFGTLRLGQ